VKEDVKQAIQSTKERAQEFGQDVRTALNSTKDKAHELSHDVRTRSKKTISQLKQSLSPSSSMKKVFYSSEIDDDE